MAPALEGRGAAEPRFGGEQRLRAVTIQTAQAAAAERACCVCIGEDLRLELAQLPSAEWLAALAAAVVGRVR